MADDSPKPIETSLSQFQRADTLASTRTGMIQRLTGAVRGFVDGFFTPGVPLPPVAPTGTPPRQYDYPLTTNIDIAPRSGMSITFADLWNLADNWDLLRVLIERRKDEMAKLSWSLAYKDADTELTDADLEIQKIFEYPDGIHDFPTFLRGILEDHLVGDCAAVEPVISDDGRLIALYGVAGRTINLKIDETGRTPMPPNTAYQQIIKGVPFANFTRQELIYQPGNLRFSRLFGTSKVEQIYILANIALRRQTQQLYSFTEGTLPEAMLNAPKEWGPQQLREFQDYFDARYTGNLKKRSKLTWLPSESKPIELKSSPFDKGFDEWMARLACFTFGISPQGFVSQMNRATAETAQDAAREEGLEPLMSFVAGLFNRILRETCGRPDLIFTWTVESQTDPKEEKDIDIGYIEHGVFSVDEVRQRKGLDPIGMKNAIWTTQGPVFVSQLISNAENPPEPADPNAEPQAVDGAKAIKALLGTPKGHLPRLPMVGGPRAKKKFSAVLKKAFKAHAKGIIDAAWDLMQTAPVQKAAGDNDKEAKEISEQLDLAFMEKLNEELQAIYDEVASQAAEQAMNQVAAVVNIDVDKLLEQADEKAIAWAQERGAELVGKKIVDGELVDNPDAKYAIDDATRDMLRDKVKVALDEGLTRDELAKSIEGGPFSADRADMIAQTELSLAHNTANRIGWQESGQVKGRYSQLSADHEEPDICDENADEGEIPLDEAYPSGDDCPPFHPRCQCGEIAVLTDDKPKEK